MSKVIHLPRPHAGHPVHTSARTQCRFKWQGALWIASCTSGLSAKCKSQIIRMMQGSFASLVRFQNSKSMVCRQSSVTAARWPS